MAKDSSNLSLGTPKTQELPDINIDPFYGTQVIVSVPPKQNAEGGFEFAQQVDNLETSNSEEPGFPTQSILNIPNSP